MRRSIFDILEDEMDIEYVIETIMKTALFGGFMKQDKIAETAA